MPRKGKTKYKESGEQYKGYSIRKWPAGKEVLIAIPQKLEIECFYAIIDEDLDEKIALKDIKLYIRAIREKNAKKKKKKTN